MGVPASTISAGVASVREDDLVDRLLADEALEGGLRFDGNPGRITGARQFGRVAPTGDARDLGGRERHHPDPGIVAVDDVEVLKVAAGRAPNEDPHGGRRHRAGPGVPRSTGDGLRRRPWSLPVIRP
jgi:hypothetical protein